MTNLLAAWAPRVQGLLRIVAGLLYVQHGLQKLFGFPGDNPPVGELVSFMGLAGGLEAFGGLSLTVGFLTRPVAFVLSGMMAVAYFMVHAPQGFFPVLNGGELAALYCFVFLTLAAAGPGAWSIDGALRSRLGVTAT
ncbi:MAG: DoxX family protein [Alphaproteobacteria bacterium]